MADKNGSTDVGDAVTSSKGKGKAAAAEPQAHEGAMDVDESSSEEEVDENDPVADEPDEDNMEEIDLDNIIPDGRRTRGRKIDFAKAAEELPEEEEDEDDDDDFEAPNEDDEMKD